MLDDRFWNKVDKLAPNGCWEWKSNKNNKGYGMFKVSAAAGNALAHRLSYKDAVGPIPSGGLILHSCDNPACVNPAHLRIGNHQQNVADMDERRRRKSPHLTGETNPWSKLTDAQVIEIRRTYVAGEHRDSIASRFGISVLSVHDLVSGKNWKHLFGAEECPTLDELKEATKKNKKANAKVTQEIAQEIRFRLASGEMGKDLAVEFGIHKATVSDIKLRKIWAD